MIEHLGEIAADIAVDLHRFHYPLEVFALHPLAHVPESVHQISSEPRFDDDAPELGGQRRVALSCDASTA